MRPLLLAAAVVLFGSGCYTAHYHYDGPKLLTTGSALGSEARVVRHFKVRDRGFYILNGIKTLGKPINGAAMAAEEAGVHDGVVNLKLSDGQDLFDIAFSNILCVMGLLCGSWSVWAEGDVVDVVGPTESVWIKFSAPTRVADESAVLPPVATTGASLPADLETP